MNVRMRTLLYHLVPLSLYINCVYCYNDSCGQLLFDIYLTCPQGGWVQAGASIGKRIEHVKQAHRLCIYRNHLSGVLFMLWVSPMVASVLLSTDVSADLCHVTWEHLGIHSERYQHVQSMRTGSPTITSITHSATLAFMLYSC